MSDILTRPSAVWLPRSPPPLSRGNVRTGTIEFDITAVTFSADGEQVQSFGSPFEPGSVYASPWYGDFKFSRDRISYDLDGNTIREMIYRQCLGYDSAAAIPGVADVEFSINKVSAWSGEEFNGTVNNQPVIIPMTAFHLDWIVKTRLFPRMSVEAFSGANAPSKTTSSAVKRFVSAYASLDMPTAYWFDEIDYLEPLIRVWFYGTYPELATSEARARFVRIRIDLEYNVFGWNPRSAD